MEKLYGGVEAGGTKFVCGIGTCPDNLVTTEFKTRDPESTIAQAVEFFRKNSEGKPLACVGIGSFGPICLDKGSGKYGFITTTPKPGWQNTDFYGEVTRKLGLPVAFDTDVNAAALSESIWGAGKGCGSLVYITIGTGIGAGVMINNTLVHGILHPEAGHMFIPRNRDDNYEGACPWHKNRCFEGLASGTAIKARKGMPGNEIGYDDPVWELEAEYISKALINFICMLAPERIILGGGVMHQTRLFNMTRERVVSGLNRYMDIPEIKDGIENYIVPPGLGDRAGVLGALALAKRNPDKGV